MPSSALVSVLALMPILISYPHLYFLSPTMPSQFPYFPIPIFLRPCPHLSPSLSPSFSVPIFLRPHLSPSPSFSISPRPRLSPSPSPSLPGVALTLSLSLHPSPGQRGV